MLLRAADVLLTPPGAYNEHCSRCPRPLKRAGSGRVILCEKTSSGSLPRCTTINAFDLNATLERLDGDRALFRELIGFFLEDNPIAAPKRLDPAAGWRSSGDRTHRPIA